jgi:hypothetical protein
MKSTFLKAVKVVALSLALSLGASGLVFANGGGVSPTKVAFNGGGNGAGGGTARKSKTKRRVARRTTKRAKTTKTAQHSTH